VIQILVLSRLGFAGLLQRKGSSLVLVGSVGCVVGVLLAMLSVTEGMLRASRIGSDARSAIVLSPFNNEYGTGIPANVIGTILDAPGIARGPDGHPLGDAEVVFWVPPTGPYVVGSPNVRGIGAAGLALRPNLRIVSGRQFRWGGEEVVVGVAAARAYGLRVGDKVTLPQGAWPIVGSFTDDGSFLESQLLGDAATLLAAGHLSGFGSVLIRLERAEAFGAFEHWLRNNPALTVNPERQLDYELRTVNRASAFFTELTYLVGVIMALGALFGVVKLTYATVSVRARELATLRAIGYQPSAVALSVLLETMVLSVLGAVLGAGTAWLLFNARQVAALQSVFALSVSPFLFGLGLVWALALAILGGLAPAIRAARLPVADALRAL
jgi:putative ABC transport system permease protein